MTQPEFTDEELRALEAEMERISVDDVLIQTVVTLLNLGARKAGLATPQTPSDPPAPAADWDQVRQAIEGARALMPLLEERHGEQLGAVRDALARLQMVYAQQGAKAAPGAPASEPPSGGAGEPPKPEGPGPAQSSGRLWVPGQ